MKIILLSLVSIVSLLASDPNISSKEDRLIVQGILAHNNRGYYKSKEIFLKLYKLTKKEEYLIRASKEAIRTHRDYDGVILILKRWIQEHKSQVKKDTKPIRGLIMLYAQKKRFDLVEKLVDRWLINSKDPKDIRMVIAAKVKVGKYSKALKLVKELYAKSHSEESIVEEAKILDKYYKQPKEAIRLLETHLHFYPNNVSDNIYYRLIELYSKLNNPQKVLDLYIKLYKTYSQKFVLEDIIKLSISLHEEERAIELLEENLDGNELILYKLYIDTKRFKKAILLADRLFKETNDPKWLAEEAVLRYEVASKEKHITPKLLKTFCKLFDKALKGGVDNSFYLNYYGYILIDHNLDIKRGIKLVRQALKQRPNYSYYLDSLAWGLYKIGQCKEAYQIMEKIFSAEEIKEPDIKIHRDIIKKCIEKDKTF